MEDRRRLFTISVAFVPLFFLLLADLAVGDYELFTFINHEIVNPFLDFICAYASPVIFAVFYILTLASLHFSKDSASKASGLVSLINGPLCYGIGSVIKDLVGRPRPFEVEALSTVRVIGLWHTSSFSFPSTTTMLVFGFSLPILLEKRRGGVPLVAISYLIGFSVIYTGFHFPLDVAAGTLFSLAITLCTNKMKNPLVNIFKNIIRIKPKNLESA